MIHIQDAHALPQAQFRIAKLLEYLRRRHGVSLIFVEGAQTRLDGKYLRLFKEEEKNRRLARALLREGELSGPEYFLMRGGRAKVFGAEDEDAYRGNLDTFRAVFRQGEESRWFLGLLNSRLEKLGSRILSPPLRRFLRHWRPFESGKNEFHSFFRILKRSALRHLDLNLEDPASQILYPYLTRFATIEKVGRDLDPSRFAREKGRLLALFRESGLDHNLVRSFRRRVRLSGSEGGLDTRVLVETLYDQMPRGFDLADYPEVNFWLGISILREEMDSEGLHREMRRLSEAVLGEMAGAEKERKLVALVRDLVLLERLFGLELTREELRGVFKRKKSLAPLQMISRLKALETGNLKPLFSRDDFRRSRVEKAYGDCLRFYRTARAREKRMVEIALQRMKALKQSRAVLVTGGFHSAGLRKRITRAGGGYIEIQPRFSQTDDRGKYLRTLMGPGALSMSRSSGAVPPAASSRPPDFIKNPAYLIPREAQMRLGADLSQRDEWIDWAYRGAAESRAAALGREVRIDFSDSAWQAAKVADLGSFFFEYYAARLFRQDDFMATVALAMGLDPRNAGPWTFTFLGRPSHGSSRQTVKLRISAGEGEETATRDFALKLLSPANLRKTEVFDLEREHWISRRFGNRAYFREHHPLNYGYWALPLTAEVREKVQRDLPSWDGYLSTVSASELYFQLDEWIEGTLLKDWVSGVLSSALPDDAKRESIQALIRGVLSVTLKSWKQFKDGPRGLIYDLGLDDISLRDGAAAERNRANPPRIVLLDSDSGRRMGGATRLFDEINRFLVSLEIAAKAQTGSDGPAALSTEAFFEILAENLGPEGTSEFLAELLSDPETESTVTRQTSAAPARPFQNNFRGEVEARLESPTSASSLGEVTKKSGPGGGYHFRVDSIIQSYEKIFLLQDPAASHYRRRAYEKMPRQVEPGKEARQDARVRKLDRALAWLRNKAAELGDETMLRRAEGIGQAITVIGVDVPTHLFFPKTDSRRAGVYHIGRRRSVIYFPLRFLDEIPENVEGVEELALYLDRAARWIGGYNEITRGLRDGASDVELVRKHMDAVRLRAGEEDRALLSAESIDRIFRRLDGIAEKDEVIRREDLAREIRQLMAEISEREEQVMQRRASGEQPDRSDYFEIAQLYGKMAHLKENRGESDDAGRFYLYQVDAFSDLQRVDRGLLPLEIQEGKARILLRAGLYPEFLKELEILLTGRNFPRRLSLTERNLLRDYLDRHQAFLEAELVSILQGQIEEMAAEDEAEARQALATMRRLFEETRARIRKEYEEDLHILPAVNIVPVITPLTARGEPDREGIRNLVRHLESLGVEAILAMGATGEFAGLDNARRLEAIRFLYQEARNRLAVFVNVTGNTEQETLSNLSAVEDTGIDAVVIAPLFYLGSSEEIPAHIKKIRTRHPVVLYNNPGLTRGKNIDPAVLDPVRGRVKGLKDSSGDLKLLTEYLKHTRVYQGDETQIVPALEKGARGSISSMGNVNAWPQQMYREGITLEERAGWQRKIRDFVPVLTAGRRKIIPGIKYVLWRDGVIGSPRTVKGLSGLNWAERLAIVRTRSASWIFWLDRLRLAWRLFRNLLRAYRGALFDIDGTLVEGGALRPGAVAWLRDRTRRKERVALVTSSGEDRVMRDLIPLFEAHRISAEALDVAVEGGAYAFNVGEKKRLGDRADRVLLTEKEARDIRRLAEVANENRPEEALDASLPRQHGLRFERQPRRFMISYYLKENGFPLGREERLRLLQGAASVLGESLAAAAGRAGLDFDENFKIQVSDIGLHVLGKTWGKDRAEAHFAERWRTRPSRLAKVGDRGDRGGNDEDFLRGRGSFSVDRFDPANPRQIPVGAFTALAGVEATDWLLDRTRDGEYRLEISGPSFRRVFSVAADMLWNFRHPRPEASSLGGEEEAIAAMLANPDGLTLAGLAKRLGKRLDDPAFKKAVHAHFQSHLKFSLHEHTSGLIFPEYLLPYYLGDSEEAREARRRFALVVTSNRSALDLQAHPVDPATISQAEADRVFAREVGFPNGSEESFRASVKKLSRFTTYRDNHAKDWDEFERAFAVIKTVTDVNPAARYELVRKGVEKQIREDSITHLEITDYHSRSIEALAEMLLAVEKGHGGNPTVAVLKAFRKDHLENLLKEERSVRRALAEYEGRSYPETRAAILEKVLKQELDRFGLDEGTIRREFAEAEEEIERQLARTGPALDSAKRERLILAYEARERAWHDIRQFEKEVEDIEVRKPEIRKRIVGISNIGDEENYINWIQAPILRRAAQIGLRVTSHVGERWKKGEYLAALKRIRREIAIGVDRLAHATVLGLDFDTVTDMSRAEHKEAKRLQAEIFEILRKKGLHVETLPTSNIRFSPAYHRYSRHGTTRFFKERISFSFHTDDSSVFETSPSREMTEIWFAFPDIPLFQILQTLEEARKNRFYETPQEVADRLARERLEVARIQGLLRPAVVVFGSARIPKWAKIPLKWHPVAKAAYTLGSLMWKLNLIPRTGGGPSIMSFVLEGYRAAREAARVVVTEPIRTQAVRIILNWFEAPSQFGEIIFEFFHFAFRKLALHLNTLGIIAMNGGFGTLDEVFEVWRRDRNVVLFGTRFWKPIIEAFKQSWRKAGIIERIRFWPLITDDPEAALENMLQPMQEGYIPKLTQAAAEAANREMREGIDKLSRLPRAIAVVGRPRPDSRELDVLEEMTRLFIRRGIPVRAASRGVSLERIRRAAGDNGTQIQVVLHRYPVDAEWSAGEKQYAEESPESTIFASDDSNHQILYTYDARGFVFLPGAIGTMNKLFDVIQTMQVGKVRTRPIVLVGREFWTPILEALEKAMLKHSPALISPRDLHLVKIVDTAEEAILALGVNGIDAVASSLGAFDVRRNRWLRAGPFSPHPYPGLEEIARAGELLRASRRAAGEADGTFPAPLIHSGRLDALMHELTDLEKKYFLLYLPALPEGSFKPYVTAGVLDYFDRVARRQPEDLRNIRRVIAESTGNQGQAVAAAVRKLKALYPEHTRELQAVIFVPFHVNPEKLSKMKRLGAAVVRHDFSDEELEEYLAAGEARRGAMESAAEAEGRVLLDYTQASLRVDQDLARNPGRVFYVRHGSRMGIAGYANIALEAADQWFRRAAPESGRETRAVSSADFDRFREFAGNEPLFEKLAFLAPAGSGGLESGLAQIKKLNPSIRVFGTQVPGVDPLFISLEQDALAAKAGFRFDEEAVRHVDGIAATPERLTFEILRQMADGVTRVPYSANDLMTRLIGGLRLTYPGAGGERLPLELEPASALPLTNMIYHGPLLADRNHLIVPVTGRLTDPALKEEIGRISFREAFRLLKTARASSLGTEEFHPAVPEEVPPGSIWVFRVGGKAYIRFGERSQRPLFLKDTLGFLAAHFRIDGARETDIRAGGRLEDEFREIVRAAPERTIQAADLSDVGLGRFKIVVFPEVRDARDPLLTGKEMNPLPALREFIRALSDQEGVRVVHARLIGGFGFGSASADEADVDLLLITEEPTDLNLRSAWMERHWKGRKLEIHAFSRKDLEAALELVETTRGGALDPYFNRAMIRAISVEPFRSSSEMATAVRGVELARLLVDPVILRVAGEDIPLPAVAAAASLGASGGETGALLAQTAQAAFHAESVLRTLNASPAIASAAEQYLSEIRRADRIETVYAPAVRLWLLASHEISAAKSDLRRRDAEEAAAGLEKSLIRLLERRDGVPKPALNKVAFLKPFEIEHQRLAVLAARRILNTASVQSSPARGRLARWIGELNIFPTEIRTGKAAAEFAERTFSRLRHSLKSIFRSLGSEEEIKVSVLAIDAALYALERYVKTEWKYSRLAERASMEYFWTASFLKEHPATQPGYEAMLRLGARLERLAKYPEENEKSDRAADLARLARRTRRVIVRVFGARLPPEQEREIIGPQGHLTQALKAVQGLRQVLGSSLGTAEARVVEGTTWDIARIDPRAGREPAPGNLPSRSLETLPAGFQSLFAADDEFGAVAAEAASLETIARMEIPLSRQKNRMLIVAYTGSAQAKKIEALNEMSRRRLEGRLIVIPVARSSEGYRAFLEDLVRSQKGMDRVRLRAQRFFRRSGHRGLLARNEFLKYLTVVAGDGILESLRAPFVMPFHARSFPWPREVREYAEIFYAVSASGLSDAERLKQKVGDSLEIHLSERGRTVAFLALSGQMLGRYLDLIQAVRRAKDSLAAAA